MAPADARTVNAEMVPPALRGLEVHAAAIRRRGEVFQAAYLSLLVVAAALAALLPDDVKDPVAAWTIAAVLVVRLALAYRSPAARWVRARWDVETARSRAWRRAVTGDVEQSDSVRCRSIGASGVADTWLTYRRFRLQHQEEWLRNRGRQHARSARALQATQAVLAAVAVGAALVQVLEMRTVAWVGLLVTVLAVVEAWSQFRRSGFIAAGYAAAARRLGELVGCTPTDVADLVRVVDEAERVLERELWTWVAINSPAVLTERGFR